MTWKVTRLARALSLAAFLVTTAAVVARAQGGNTQSQYDRSNPPQHAAGVSSFGSYMSTELGTINLANGSLNLKIPLGQVGGRGLWLPLSLNYSSKVWSAETGTEVVRDPQLHQENPVYAVYDSEQGPVDYYNRLGAGWTLGATPVIQVKGVGISESSNPADGCTNFQYVLTKLTVILPDRGEIEMRDDFRDGAPVGALSGPGSCRQTDGWRGRRWHAADGSGLVFVSDVDGNSIVTGDLNGTLITSDGTRFHFRDEVPPPPGGSAYMRKSARADLVRDRNGNQLRIDYSTRTVRYTDPLGRVTSVEFDVVEPNTGETFLAVVTLPGYGERSQQYKIRKGVMSQNYRAGISPQLPVYNGQEPGNGGYENCLGGPRERNYTQLFEGWCGGARRLDNLNVLTQLVLPDGRALSFKYNEYGEVAEVEMPTGGRVQYDYAYDPYDGLPSGNSPAFEVQGLPGGVGNVREIDRAVVARRTYPDGQTSGPAESYWSYDYSATRGPNGEASNGTTEVVARASDDATVLLRQKHYFMDARTFLDRKGGTGYRSWSAGLERRVETLNAAGTSVIAASEEVWSQRASVVWATGFPSQQIPNDNRVDEERNILDDGKVARKTYRYDDYNNPAEISEYDFDGSLARRTVTSYSATQPVNGVNYADDSIRLIRLPLQQSVYDAGGEQARTTYEYDIYAPDGNHEALQVYFTDLPITGYDAANFGPGRAARGNQTRVGRWRKSDDGYVYTYTRYDVLGNVVSVKDPRGFVATISYQDNFGDGTNIGDGVSQFGARGTNGPTFALPTQLTSPPPRPGEQPHTAQSQYDFSTGLLTGFRDRNGVITQTRYDDPFNRPTLVRAALGTPAEAQTQVMYAPQNAFGITLSNNDVLTAKDINTAGDASVRSWTRTDGFGRTVEAWTRDPQGDVAVKTVYDALGRVQFASNPYRSQAAATDGWARTTYDAAGRVTEVATFSGPPSAAPPEAGTNANFTGRVVTSYAGNGVTATDQSNRKRKTVTDALGRLTAVYEDPDGANHETAYSYNVLDNLTAVTQGAQTRSFRYDSLARLLSAANPESGTVTYLYDESGNLERKTDARGVSTFYAYDAMNRVRTITYSDSTPAVTYAYDTAANGKGRLSSVSSSVSVYSYTSYDQMGRVKECSQSTNGRTYAMAYAYNLAGGLTSQTYPSGRVVETEYDEVGRLAGARRPDGSYYAGASPADAANKLRYTAGGAVAALRLGNGLWEHTSFNSLMQPVEIGLGASSADSSKLRLSYSYGTSNNNGNLQAQTITIPGLTLTQNYTYDALNRLETAAENGGASWKQRFTYDRFGNRRIDANSANTSSELVGPNPVISEANNRIVPQAGEFYQYDPSGNLIRGREGQTYAFDAENRMTTFNGGPYPNPGASYSYDGDGRRVSKAVGTQTTVFVYNAMGQLVAEYADAPAERNGTQYLTADTLGSARVITNAAGNVESRHDYHPFGEEVGWRGGRGEHNGYVGDHVRQKFTGYENDGESGLDYAKARYYASPQGRFISPDPLLASGKPLEPQSWNRYTYCLNDPLAFTDPSGLMWVYQDQGKGVWNIAWFTGKKIPKGWSKYTGPDTLTSPDGAATIRLGKRGTYEVIPNPPQITISGQGAVNMAAGFIDSAPGGQWARRAAGITYADETSGEYQNTYIIATGVGLGKAALSLKAGIKALSSLSDDTVTLFHGSYKSADEILAGGLNINKAGATYVSTDIAAAEDAIRARMALGEATNHGIITSRVSRGEFRALIDSEDIGVRGYQGFFPRRLNTVEYQLRTPAAKDLFNKGIQH